MDQTSPATNSSVSQPVQKNSQYIWPPAHLSPPPNRPKKLFFKNPIFWIVVILFLVVSGELYLVSKRVDHDQINKVTNAVKEPINLPSPTLEVSHTISSESAQTLKKIVAYYPKSTIWKEEATSINILRNGKKMEGAEELGTYVSDGKADWCEVFCEDSDELKKDGWIEDTEQSGDGLFGSVRAYKKITAGKEQLLRVEWKRDRRGEYPVTYTYNFFVSNLL